MKVTSYEISKKLHELEFKAETKNWWILSAVNEPTHQLQTYNRFEDYIGDNYRAYDFETLFDSLRERIKFKNKLYFFAMFRNIIGYSDQNDPMKFKIFEYVENQSLADAGGKLLIKLHKKGLIKFEKKILELHK